MRDMAVDRYLKSNRRFAESETYPDMTALYRALDHDEYDILYGINDSEYYDKQRSIIKNAAYKEINGKTLTIIYECPCKTTKKTIIIITTIDHWKSCAFVDHVTQKNTIASSY